MHVIKNKHYKFKIINNILLRNSVFLAVNLTVVTLAAVVTGFLLHYDLTTSENLLLKRIYLTEMSSLALIKEFGCVCVVPNITSHI